MDDKSYHFIEHRKIKFKININYLIYIFFKTAKLRKYDKLQYCICQIKK